MYIIYMISIYIYICMYILSVTCTLSNQTHWPRSAKCEIWRRKTQPASAANCNKYMGKWLQSFCDVRLNDVAALPAFSAKT